MQKGDTRQFSPQALFVARSYRGLSIGELSVRSGVSRTVVSGLENAKAAAYPNAIVAIAETLRFPAVFFQLDVPMPDRDVLHFRRKARVPEKAIDRARAIAALFAHVASSFDRYATFSHRISPHRGAQAPEEIEEVAANFRSRLGLPVEAPLANCVNVAEGAGAFVGLVEAGDVPIDGFCWSSEVQIILLKSEAPWSRRRFSLMHELGHLLLHTTKNHEKPQADVEAEANRFAGAILVPRSAFWREFPRPSGLRFDWAGMFAMKARWGVSIQALIHRALDLGIIGQAQYRRANIHVSKFGWKRNEPGEKEPETPSVCQRFLADLSCRVPIRDYANSLSVSAENIEELFGVRLARSEDSGCWPLQKPSGREDPGHAAGRRTPPRLVPLE